MPRSMSPAVLARAECANLLTNGSCMGVHWDCLFDDGQRKLASPQPSCLVAAGKRCEYFERVILPLADQPSPSDDPGLQAARECGLPLGRGRPRVVRRALLR